MRFKKPAYAMRQFENRKEKCKMKHDLSLSNGMMTPSSEQIPKIVAVGHLGQRLFCNNANELQFHVSNSRLDWYARIRSVRCM